MSLTVATFYKFVPLPDCQELQAPLLAYCQQHQLCGTILLAAEGINATIAGTPTGIQAAVAYLQADARLADLEVKYARAETVPFQRLKVRLKSEIVTLGQPDVDPSDRVGTYVDPTAWNALISDPDVTVIDTRNAYEVEIGSFQGARNPETDSFREFPEYVTRALDPSRHKKVALFCTGGIRCEKATSYLLARGFDRVYHLKGGILKYLETVPTQDSLWQGECFVFDERVAVSHGLTPGSHELCLGCGHPIAAADKQSPHYEPGICCPYCQDRLTPAKRARLSARQQQRSDCSGSQKPTAE